MKMDHYFEKLRKNWKKLRSNADISDNVIPADNK
jgi:hypothetical protein